MPSNQFYQSSNCFSCRKELPGKDLKRCSRCRGPLYCSARCQRADWPNHKPRCHDVSIWYDKYRACKDGSVHEGRLELITWDAWDDDLEEMIGWGGVFKDEVPEHKHMFEVELQGDLKKFFKHWPQGFRWTCCGLGGGTQYGCDHHGSGSKPCTCDFCRMGKPVTDKIFNEKNSANYGLQLRQGPDPRSYNASMAAICREGRAMLQLDE